MLSVLSSMPLSGLSKSLSFLLECGLSQSANPPGSGGVSSSSVVRVCSSVFGASVLSEIVEHGRSLAEDEREDQLKDRWLV